MLLQEFSIENKFLSIQLDKKTQLTNLFDSVTDPCSTSITPQLPSNNADHLNTEHEVERHELTTLKQVMIHSNNLKGIRSSSL